ncbi:MAG TPA: M1 family aminopeptidase [Telluria sp.]|nr:M1 family aminopeptidase [Telluria sp.]
MFAELFKFDLRYHLRNPLLWVCALPLVLLAFLTASQEHVRIGGPIGNAHLNAPWVVANELAVLSILSMFLVTSFIAGAILRDNDSGIADLLFATRLRKRDYLLGRFLAGWIVCAVLFALVVLAMAGGASLPASDPRLIGPFDWRTYAFGYFAIVLPNLLFVAALLVLLAALTRSLLAVYAGALAFLALWAGASFLGQGNAPAGALLDPFGVRVLAQSMRYFTGAERNTVLPQLSGALLANRLLWSVVAVGLLGATLALFKPVRPGTGRGWRKVRAARPEAAAPRTAFRPRVPSFANAALVQWWQMARFDARGVLRSVPFIVMLLLAVANFFANYTVGGLRFDATPYPLTRLMLDEIAGGMNAMLVIVLLFYAGELVHKDRQARMHGLTDAMPVTAWVPLCAKFSALVLVVLAFQCAGVLAALAIQLVVGGAPIEPLLYLKGTLIGSTGLLLTGAGLLGIHAMCSNKYLGHALGIALLASGTVLESLGVDRHLFRFAELPALTYSDLNGYGHYLTAWAWHVLYWALATGALLALASCVTPRGADAGGRARWAAGRRALRGAPGAVVLACASGVLACGAWIHYNTHILNRYQSRTAQLDERAAYELTYRHVLAVPQPKIAAITVALDLYPERQALALHGQYTLRNDSAAPIDTLYVQRDTDADTRLLQLPPHAVVVDDRRFGMLELRLRQPLAPGASMPFSFDVRVERHGFTNANGPDLINENGTLFTNEHYFPKFGYDPSRELTGQQERAQRGLPSQDGLPALSAPHALTENYLKGLGIDAGAVSFDATVSTSADQTAIAPGDLLEQWQEHGRRYFHYRLAQPELPFLSFQSGRWQVKRARWNGVDIEVYFDPRHAYNVDSMIAGAQAAIAYGARHFGPYPQKVLRIVETPRYVSLARSFPTVIPFSESLGFISDLRDPDRVNHVFYVTAHEVAHKWWGEQGVAANMRGNLLITESLAEYTALMTTRERYGNAKLLHILDFDLDSYLSGRASAREPEPPLADSADEVYLGYRKGSLAFYRLERAIGRERIDAALRALLAKGRTQAVYLTSRDLIDALRAQTPPEQQGLITELFEQVVLHDLRVQDARARPRAGGGWRLRAQVRADAQSFGADGKASALAGAQEVELAVLGASGQELARVRRMLPAGVSVVTLDVAGQPARVVIDPDRLLIDRNQADNSAAVERE